MSKFCDRVLDGGLGEADKEDINYIEAYDLLQHMQRKKQQLTPRSPLKWITETIKDLLESPTDSDIEAEESDSDSDSEPEEADPKSP